MKYKGIVGKSRTLDWSVLLAVFGVIEMNLPMVKEQLGDYYGWVFIGSAVITAVLRKVTTKPLGASDGNDD